ncbi:MAG: bifunctional methylenetetrahydrofolate dehydrogenase/methenyltetrahydrofolate cyclohydrolase FolD [Phototrophicales bacterium]|nr:MAG: bifunctional methylenetetrahydrofolate dehydrogenase/methenyltetrahydrofolate cyclohydrolase FolD [Phototrophicales bacterium]
MPILDGKAIAEQMRQQIAADVEALVQKTGVRPGLAAVLVGDNPASQTYVRMKQRACEAVGIHSVLHEIPADVDQATLESLIQKLNADQTIHGILVQLPLPKHLDEQRILDLVRIEKDVDGLHPLNMGHLAMKGREPLFMPATPAGCMVLLEKAGVKFSGANAVVIGRSNIVGLPAALMLLKRDATVTIVHSRTPEPSSIVRQADIVIAAAGRAAMVKADWIKHGAVVIDVGTNRVDDPTAKRGYRLVGDVDFEAVKDKALITPVPGGVGPMTITMLLSNTLKAAQYSVAR